MRGEEIVPAIRVKEADGFFCDVVPPYKPEDVKVAVIRSQYTNIVLKCLHFMKNWIERGWELFATENLKYPTALGAGRNRELTLRQLWDQF